jgi:hypothetical protein
MKNISKIILSSFAIISGAITSVNADQVISDDLVTVGSLCVGLDCNSGETFGFDTIRLKENNLRIRFIDTSSSSAFPTRDWQIKINDSTNGGSNYFAVENMDTEQTPFKVMDGAKNDSLYVSPLGYIGLGTSTPGTHVEIKNGNSPTIRLNQDGSSGFSAQAWDMGGNESNFFVRDVTNNGSLPLRIQSGARAASIYVAKDGDIGFGTTTPDAGLDMVMSIPAIRMGNSTDINGGNSWTITAQPSEFTIMKSDNGSDLTGSSNFSPLRIKRTAPDSSLVIDQNLVSIDNNTSISGKLTVAGNIVATGSIFNASDKNLKENFKKVDYQEILNKINKLDITLWNYKKEDKSIRHIGPMAQDFYSIFKVGVNNKTISALDAAAIAISGAKALSTKLEEKELKIKELKKEVERLKNIESRVIALEEFIKKASIFSVTPNTKESSNFQDSDSDSN